MEKITVKESYLRKKVAVEEFIRGKIVLSNEKSIMLYFNSDKNIIEAGSCDGKVEDSVLTEAERIAIIQFILRKYTSFYNSIFHLTTHYFIETYKLIDVTNIEEVTNEDIHDIMKKQEYNILEELIASQHTEESEYNIYRELKIIYNYIKNYPTENCYIFQISTKLKGVEIKDLEYYLSYFLSKYGKYEDYDINYNNHNKIFLITVDD